MALAASDGDVALVARCAGAFTRFAAAPDERPLAEGYELGREALANGLGVLQIVEVCTLVLADTLGRADTDVERRRLTAAADQFFSELVSPYEMTHRAFRDANAVLRRLNDALEAQSRQIANALHDDAAQLLVPIHLGLADVARQVAPATAKTLTELRCLLDEVEEQLRRIAHDLRPAVLEDLGLLTALEVLASNITARWHLPVTLHVELDTALPATIETAIYRIVQESLTNVVRHAAATQAWLTLAHRNGSIRCSIHDDGVGLTEPRLGHTRGLGLASLQERVAALGGRIEIGRGEGDRGTVVAVDIPLAN